MLFRTASEGHSRVINAGRILCLLSLGLPLPVEFQPELHVARIGLHVGNFSELAPELVHGIHLATRSRR